MYSGSSSSSSRHSGYDDPKLGMRSTPMGAGYTRSSLADGPSLSPPSPPMSSQKYRQRSNYDYDSPADSLFVYGRPDSGPTADGDLGARSRSGGRDLGALMAGGDPLSGGREGTLQDDVQYGVSMASRGPPRKSLHATLMSPMPGDQRGAGLNFGDERKRGDETSDTFLGENDYENSILENSHASRLHASFAQMEKEASRLTDTSTWVTIFGFDQSHRAEVLQHFQRYGDMADHVKGKGNWVFVQYRSRLQAQQAIAKSGQIVADGIMVGVVATNEREIIKLNKGGHGMGGIRTAPRPAISKVPQRDYILVNDKLLGPSRVTDWWTKITEYFWGYY